MASAVAAVVDRSRVPDLLSRLAATGGWVAGASLAVLARLLPEASDRELAELELRSTDEPLPRWAEQLDEVVIAGPARLRDPLGDADLIALELLWPGSDPLTILLLLDHNLGSTITRSALLRWPLDVVLTSFAEQPEAGTERVPLTHADARATIEAARWSPSHCSWPGEPAAADLRPLVEWLMTRLPTGGAAPHRPAATPAELQAIRDRFLDSPWGRALNAPGRHEVIDALLDAAADGDDPLRWSAARVGHLDLEALADGAWFAPDALAAVPDLLRALIGFAHDERGIARRHTDAAMAEVDRRWREALADLLLPWSDLETDRDDAVHEERDW